MLFANVRRLQVTAPRALGRAFEDCETIFWVLPLETFKGLRTTTGRHFDSTEVEPRSRSIIVAWPFSITRRPVDCSVEGIAETVLVRIADVGTTLFISNPFWGWEVRRRAYRGLPVQLKLEA